jgi:CRP/FNR family cyclic AMP-dependent transcriptional regulator
VSRLKEEVEVLRRNPLFAEIDASKLKFLAFISERIAFEAGDILFHQGDIGDAAYFILEGEAELLANGPSEPVLVAVLGRNAFVGEIAILCDIPRTTTVRARQGLVCLRIAKDPFIRLVSECPQIAFVIDHWIGQRLSQALAGTETRN